MWQFSARGRGTVRRMPRARRSRSPAATCRSTTRPATRPIHPTPVVGGARRDRRRRARASPPAGRTRATTSTCSASPATELDGSAWAGVVHGHLGGRPPAVDLEAREAARRRCSRAGGTESLIASRPRPVRRRTRPGARRGGPALRRRRPRVAQRDHGARRGGRRAALFGESTGRVIVAVPREDDVKFVGLCEGRGYPVLRIGVTDAGGAPVRCSRSRTTSRSRWTNSAPPTARCSPPRSAPSPSPPRSANGRDGRERGTGLNPVSRTFCRRCSRMPDARHPQGKISLKRG